MSRRKIWPRLGLLDILSSDYVPSALLTGADAGRSLGRSGARRRHGDRRPRRRGGADRPGQPAPGLARRCDPRGPNRRGPRGGARRLVGTASAWADIEELEKFGDDIVYVGGKIGFNAFANTELETILRGKDIESVLICGMVTSLCIDSSGRAAYERGYDVTIVSDCTSGRTATEHEFYCQSVFPLYGAAKPSDDILASMH
jgi:hypothetical protein